MKYIEINKRITDFYSITLEDILLRIQPYIENFKWSIQLIDGVGNIEKIIGMNIVELEKYCDNSPKGYIIDFSKLMTLSKTFKDIIDILIVGCEEEGKIPKAYKDDNWENNCNVIISREDSSLWQLFSQNSNIFMNLRKQ
ncbi:MAG: hypothetical protein JEZ12_17575 [Desulfobacterium sp.]|nr:hypothetical protein [Desulfobacterium sp.]